MTLPEAQQIAYDKLTTGWQSAKKLGERLFVLNRLVAKGMAERYRNPDSHFSQDKRTAFRLPNEDMVLCENDITHILEARFPEREWLVRHDVLAFTIVARSGIVSFVLNVPCDELVTVGDIEQAGQEVVAGLEDALRRRLQGYEYDETG